MILHLGLLWVFDLDRWPYATIVLIAGTFLAYARAAVRLETAGSARSILWVAIALRVLLLPLPPTLSDDTLRYVWDGRVVSAGFNPYLLAPEEEELASLRDDLWQRMPHRHVPTVYPPLALVLFTIASWLPSPLITVKILLCICEIIGCYLLVRLVEKLGLPQGRVVWYAWNPLPILEVAGMGHIDGVVVAAQIAAVLFLVERPPRALLAASAGAAAVLAKLLPVVALPIWARASGRPMLFAASAGLLITCILLPVFLLAGGVPPGLVKYGVSWEFNGPIYEPLWRLFEVAEADRAIKTGLDGIKDAWGHHAFWNRLYPFVYPQFLAKLCLLGGFGIFFLLHLRKDHPVLATGRLFGGFLLAMATFYPWYLLLILPWAAICKHRAWLLLSALLQIAYVSQLLEIAHWPGPFALIWVPFFMILVRSKWSIS